MLPENYLTWLYVPSPDLSRILHRRGWLARLVMATAKVEENINYHSILSLGHESDYIATQ